MFFFNRFSLNWPEYHLKELVLDNYFMILIGVRWNILNLLKNWYYFKKSKKNSMNCDHFKSNNLYNFRVVNFFSAALRRPIKATILFKGRRCFVKRCLECFGGSPSISAAYDEKEIIPVNYFLFRTFTSSLYLLSYMCLIFNNFALLHIIYPIFVFSSLNWVFDIYIKRILHFWV